MKPLSEVTVIELGTFITGPYAGMLLADLGAKVLKIEQPKQGDPFRNYQGRQYSPQFQAYNKNKRSITLDIKSRQGRAIFCNLLSGSDVLVENFRPEVLTKLDFGWDRLRAINSKLINCSITGFGSTGPYVDRPCYDTVAQALSGYLSQFVDPKMPRLAGPAVADAITGLFAAYGILGALFERARTGEGKRVEVAMLDALVAFSTEPFANFFSTGRVPTPFSRPSVSQSYVLTCADDRLIALHLASPEKFWNGLVRCIERTDLACDPRFSTREDRVAHFEELTGELQLSFKTKPLAYWIERLPMYDVPHAAVSSLDEVVRNPQVQYREIFCNVHHTSEGDLTCIQSPILYDGKRAGNVFAPPVLGEDTDSVLTELGMDRSQIDELRNTGVI